MAVDAISPTEQPVPAPVEPPPPAEEFDSALEDAKRIAMGQPDTTPSEAPLPDQAAQPDTTPAGRIPKINMAASMPNAKFQVGPTQDPSEVPIVPTPDDVYKPVESDPQKRHDLNAQNRVSADMNNNWPEWGYGHSINKANLASHIYNDPHANWHAQYLLNTPGAFDAIDRNKDGEITREEMNTFANESRVNTRNAMDAYSEWERKNPYADPASKVVARGAAIVNSQYTAISGGDTYIHTGHLDKYSKEGWGSSQALEAAKFYSTAGMLNHLDMAGNPTGLNKPDGLIGADNINAWLRQGAPGNSEQLAAILHDAAFFNISQAQMPANAKDIFNSPNQYTPAQKATALRELTDLEIRVNSLVASGLWNNDYARTRYSNRLGLNPAEDAKKVLADIKEKKAALLDQKDLQTYIRENMPGELKAIVETHPELKSAIETTLKNIEGGRWGGANPYNVNKDDTGKDISIPGRLTSLSYTVETFNAALGNAPLTDIKKYLSSGQLDDVKKYFDDNISNGNIIVELAEGSGPIHAFSGFVGLLATFAKFMPDGYFSPAKQDEIVKNAQGKLTGVVNNTDWSKIKAVFEDKDGNFDVNKATEIVNEMFRLDPEAFRVEGQPWITATEIVTQLRAAWDGGGRQPAKIVDALNKIDGRSRSLPQTPAYKAGAMHIISGMFAAAAGFTRGTGDPQQIAGTVAAGAVAIGLFKEGGSKSVLGGDVPPLKGGSLETRLKYLENSGKLVGAAGGFLGSVLGFMSFADALNKGQPVHAALNFLTATAGSVSSGASAVEGAVNIASISKFVQGANLGRYALVAGVTGWVTAGVTFAVTFALMIYDIVKFEQHINLATDLLRPTVDRYGVTGGEVKPEDEVPVQSTNGGS